jgi:RimJ/RimL family protein N-acetyltransferase
MNNIREGTMLEGKLVNLRALEPGDVDREFQWVNDREVTRYLTIRYPMAKGEEERWLTNRPANDFRNTVFAIETRDGVHIGNCGLHDGQPENRRASLGIMIGDKDYWSNGYGSDAIITLLRFGFHEMNLNRVWLHVYDFNERAQACYKKVGFVAEGTLRENSYREGRYVDTITMGILRSEFDALHRGGRSDA